jgi:dTDP-4-amino-4,6-dideoxygalactose transaminase
LGPGRDAAGAALRAQGIEVGVHYPIPLHLQRALASLGHAAGAFPAAERAAAEVLSLPLFPLVSETQQDRVVAALEQAL